MHWTRTLIPTLKQPPAGVKGIAEQLLLRAGLVRQDPEGGLDYLPMGFRVLDKLANLLRASFAEIGFSEVLLSRPPTAATVEPIAKCIHSYKQLPVGLFQIAADALGAPRLDAVCLESDQPSLTRRIASVRDAFRQVLLRCKVQSLIAKTVGGEHLVALSPGGLDQIVMDEQQAYVATRDVAETAARPWTFAGSPQGPLEKVHTPALTSVDEVCAFLKISPRQILKTLVFQATSPIQINWVVAVVRGDHHVSQWKLSQAARSLGVSSVRLVDSPELRARFTVGFVGPDAGTKTPDAVLIVDPDAAQGNLIWTAGANERDYHVCNFNWFRDAGDRLADPAKVIVADIRDALEGDLSPSGGTFHQRSVINLGSIHVQDTELSESNVATFDDGSGVRRPLHIGRICLDLAAIIRASAEASHDERGIMWPAAIAPCAAVVTPIQYDGEVKQAADRLYTQLTFEGIDTILDDRDARAGFKFADADLVGFPVRINVGQKNLSQRLVEMKRRTSAEAELIPIDGAVSRIRAALLEL